jgi:hypothetical protein
MAAKKATPKAKKYPSKAIPGGVAPQQLGVKTGMGGGAPWLKKMAGKAKAKKGKKG